MPSSNTTSLPQWVAPLGFRWFAPTLLIVLLGCNLGVATFTWLHRPTVYLKVLLIVLWIVGPIGSVLLCWSWRSLLRNSRTSVGPPPDEAARPSNNRWRGP